MVISGKRLYVSYPCWGKQFVSLALEASLPSYFSSNNLPYLISEGFSVTIQFFTDEQGEHLLRTSSLVARYSDSVSFEFVAIDTVASGATNNDKLIACHNYSMQCAAASCSLLFLACSDLVISNSALQYFYQQISRGYKVVLCSALRVSLEASFPTITGKISANINALDAELLVDIALDNLHRDETRLVVGEGYIAEGWPGNLMWASESTLVKRGIYLCPFLIQTDENDVAGFGAASLDNAQYLNKYLETWSRDVFVVQESESQACLDLTFDDYEVVGIRQFTASDDVRALHTAASMHVNPCQPWHYKTLEFPIIYRSKNKGRVDVAALLTRSERYVAMVATYADKYASGVFSENCLSAIDFERYRRALNFGAHGVDIEKTTSNLRQLLQKMREENTPLVCYGMGDYLYLLESEVDFSQNQIFLTDSNYERIHRGFKDYACIDCTSLADVASNVVIFSKAFADEIECFINNEYHDIRVHRIIE